MFKHDENEISRSVSKGPAGLYWLKDFLKRNLEVKQMEAQNLNSARAQMVNKFIV